MITLYILNVFDILATIFLIQSGLAREGNFLMINIVDNYFLSFLLKIIFIGAFLYLMYYLSKIADKFELKIINLAISVGLFFYVAAAANSLNLYIRG